MSDTNSLIRKILQRAPFLRATQALKAIASVDRGLFVPKSFSGDPYDTTVVQLDGYSLSEPSLVAYMVHVLDLKSTDRVLDVGCGSGYHAAVMSRLCEAVFGMDILPHVLERARESLRLSGCDNVQLSLGDGWEGWTAEAPYDAINVACAAECVPVQLVSQLKVGGRMVIPVAMNEGSSEHHWQNLLLIERTGTIDKKPQYRETILETVRFMLMKHVG
jgi:protein-L-isoaspartate(D-aspartate) O-methyltransferase